MSSKLSNVISIYDLRARVAPISLMFLPVLIVGAIYSIEFKTYEQVLSGFAFPAVLPFFLAHLGRDRGKNLEQALWKEWGGVPSIQVLRWRNNQFDEHTKRRIHQKLQQLMPVSNPPTEASELQDPIEADKVYTAWSNFLRTKTRDTEKFSLLFKENINYGFRRNFYGLKGLGIVVLVVLLGAVYGYNAAWSKTFNPIKLPKTFWLSIAVILVYSAMWLFMVTKNWIKVAAFAYAERLCEATEDIS